VGLDWEKYVEVDPKFYRPADVHVLCGDASRARAELGWEPEVDFQGLVHLMVDSDLDGLK
jgi:GDPmannose 4,6-dehydratase